MENIGSTDLKKTELLKHVITKYKYRNVPKNDIQKMISYCRFVKYKKDEHVYMEEDEIKYLYFILKGSVESYVLTSLTTKKVLSNLHSGDDFSMPAVIESYYSDRRYMTNAVCLENCEIGLIPKNETILQILTIPSINCAFLEMMAMIIREFCSEFIAKKAEEKIAAYLCYLIKENKLEKDGVIYIPRKNSIQKMADILSLTRESVHRILFDFEKLNMIKIEKDKFIVNDKDKLMELSRNIDSLMGFYGSA